MKKYLLYLCYLIWPFGLLLSFQTPFLAQPIYFLDLSVFLLFIVTIFKKEERGKISEHDLSVPLVVFLSVLSLSLLVNVSTLSQTSLVTALMYLLRVLVYPSLYFASIGEKQDELKKIATFSFILFLLLGLSQYLFLPDIRYLRFLGFDDHYYRLVGTLFDPNFTGAILASTCFLLFYSGQYFLLALSLISLALTFSRASYLSFVLPLFLFAYLFKNKKVILILFVLGLAVFLSPKPFGEGVNLFRTFSIYSRLDSWGTGFNLFLQKPLVGWGYNTLTTIGGQKTSIDNSFLYILATSGLLGLMTFLSLLRSIFKNTSNINQVALVSILIHSLFNNSLFFVWILAFFWVSISLRFKE